MSKPRGSTRSSSRRSSPCSYPRSRVPTVASANSTRPASRRGPAGRRDSGSSAARPTWPRSSTSTSEMRQQTRLIAGVLVAVTVGAAAVALGIALLLGHIVHLRTTANATLRTGTYLDATINLESKVVDAETGLRGYVITGNRLFLSPTQAAESALPAATLALEQAAEREGAYVSRATALADAARFYMASYVPAVQREVTTNPPRRAVVRDDCTRQAARRRHSHSGGAARAPDLRAPGGAPALGEELRERRRHRRNRRARRADRADTRARRLPGLAAW